MEKKMQLQRIVKEILNESAELDAKKLNYYVIKNERQLSGHLPE